MKEYRNTKVRETESALNVKSNATSKLLRVKKISNNANISPNNVNKLLKMAV